MGAVQGTASVSAQLGLLIEQALRSRAARRGNGEPPPARASEPPIRIQISKPLGESGAAVGSVGLQNSFLRMFIVESSHLPAQVRRAAVGDLSIRQDVKLSVMILPGGAPLAVAGAAETRLRSADGGQAVMTELAYASGLRQAAVSLAEPTTGAGYQVMPLIQRETDSLFSARHVLDDRALLLRSAAAGEPPTGLLRSASGGALQSMIRELERLSTALAQLEGRFAGLRAPAAFAGVRAASSQPIFLKVQAGPGAAAGNYSIQIERAAQGQAIESDAIAPAPLNLSGQILVNGSPVTVAASDTLFDLAAKINRGEDTNGNGTLEAGEDANANGRLDGGTVAHGVRASFYGNRLRLENTGTTVGDIRLDDPDGILRAVGLVAYDANGQTTFPHEVAAAQDALIRVDGREFRSADNVFSDAVAGLKLTVLGAPAGAVKVTVEPDTSTAADALESALEGFNSAMRTMNGGLSAFGGVLARDPTAARVRLELTAAMLDPVGGQPADLDEASEAGIERAGRFRAIFSETQLASAARRLLMGSPPPETARAHEPPSVYNALDELGITAAGDDTFQLDREKFEKVLSERPAEVADLFTRAEEGIVARIVGRLDEASGESGSLARRRSVLESLLGARISDKFAKNFLPDVGGILVGGLGGPVPEPPAKSA